VRRLNATTVALAEARAGLVPSVVALPPLPAEAWVEDATSRPQTDTLAADHAPDHHQEPPAPEPRQNATLTVLASWPVSETPAGRLVVEVVERVGKKKLAVTWINARLGRRTMVEIPTLVAPKLLEGVRAAAGSLGVEIGGPSAPERDPIWDRVHRGERLERGAWRKPTPEPRRPR